MRHTQHMILPNINSKATNGPTQDDTSGAVYLGAVELNQILGDLFCNVLVIEIPLVRQTLGDPSHLGSITDEVV